jgi:hypothetical protein
MKNTIKILLFYISILNTNGQFSSYSTIKFPMLVSTTKSGWIFFGASNQSDKMIKYSKNEIINIISDHNIFWLKTESGWFIEKSNVKEISKMSDLEIEDLSFDSFYTIAENEVTIKNGRTLFNKLTSWDDYERFLILYPSYSRELEVLAYQNLQRKALEKQWCSYCCEIYLKMFKNHGERRSDVIEWRRFAYNFEMAERNAKTISDNNANAIKAITNANEKARQNEPKICTTCGGRGVCMKCNGKGFTACDYHDTNNDGHCTTCNDRGILNCRTCDNKGTCSTCRGKGKIF